MRSLMLSEENIEEVAAMLRERFEGKTFAIASAHRVDHPDTTLDLRTGCRLEADWVDGSSEAVRVMAGDGGRWLGFSAGHYFWSFNSGSQGRARFSFDHDGVEISFYAPCGDRHRHYFRAERGGLAE